MAKRARIGSEAAGSLDNTVASSSDVNRALSSLDVNRASSLLDVVPTAGLSLLDAVPAVGSSSLDTASASSSSHRVGPESRERLAPRAVVSGSVRHVEGLLPLQALMLFSLDIHEVADKSEETTIEFL